MKIETKHFVEGEFQQGSDGNIRVRNGTQRIVAPATTIERVTPHLKKMGITRVANITGLDRIGIPVFNAVRPNSRSISVSQGKGQTANAAKASALMEAIELHHAETSQADLRWGAFEDLLHEPEMDLLDPKKLARFANKTQVDSTRILWQEGVELVENIPIWVPHDVVSMDYRIPLPSGAGMFLRSSNGLASGNHILEAIIHGICEIIERDSYTFWSYGSRQNQQQSCLELKSVSDPGCSSLLDKFYRAKIVVAVWDITSDIGVPAFRCVVTDNAENLLAPFPSFAGFGCHPDPCIALSRALTEAAQSRLTMISSSRDDLFSRDYELFYNRDRLKSEREEVDHAQPHLNFGDISGATISTLNECVELLLRKLTLNGLTQVIAVDLTKPELAIPVVRIIIPGLEPQHELSGYSPSERLQKRLGIDNQGAIPCRRSIYE